MEKEFKFQYELIAEDYIEAFELLQSKKKLILLDKVLAIFLLIFSLVLLWLYFQFSLPFWCFITGLIMLVIGIFDFLFPLFFQKKLRKSQIQKKIRDIGIQKLVFNDSIIKYSTNDISSDIHYKFYNKVFESESLFILTYGKKDFSVIPKRGIDQGLIEDFKNFINKKIIFGI